ncbi:hypothetical protein CWE12_10660 [Aliidiomarina sedimenti]|uniref:PpiC domain-containing protein n=1 Tax=Aliidiomarina sedimenti TaxID=1933879 RepID=A0ABY0BWS5_9GAMM|nr:hypothetical protein [Aliidiomarina sedimenti]RUO28767.1 hypothetical protein CWE12_10660 [Aliidiomarina sedimenti]
MLIKVGLTALPLSLLVLGTSGVNAQAFESLTVAEAERQCNQSVQYAQQCREDQNRARLLGFRDLPQYLHFVEVVERELATGKSAVDIKPIYETEEFIEASEYVARGQAVPPELATKMEAVFESRQELLASALGVEPDEVEVRLDNYRRYIEFVEAQSELETTQFVILSDDEEEEEDFEIIEVRAHQVDDWGSSSLSVRLGATEIIQDTGIYHPYSQPLIVVIRVTDTLRPQQRRFAYRESSGAIPLDKTWQACPTCPVAIRPY